MVLDIAVTDKAGIRCFAEFRENGSVRFAEHVCLDIEPAAMGHADDHVGRSVPLSPGKRCVEQGDQGFASFEGKTRLAGELPVEELFEQRRLLQPLKDAAPVFRGQHSPVARGFHPLHKPLPCVLILDVHELGAD